ncbi:MAG: ApaG protein [Rhodothermales bacterium]|jgi:ApaG protein
MRGSFVVHTPQTMVPYAATTEDITVTVRPVYLDGQSDVLNKRFVFGYFVRIENGGSGEVQLLRRHWHIQDSSGRVQEVEGEGIVGKTPVIQPGEYHEYNSFCIIETFEGSMEGTYLMEREYGSRFKVNIPLFNLRAAAN